MLNFEKSPFLISEIALQAINVIPLSVTVFQVFVPHQAMNTPFGGDSGIASESIRAYD
jgi:hypothetical protein